MAPLKPSEKRLLVLFVGLGFVLANYFGFTWVSQRQAALAQERATLEQERTSYQQLAVERDRWSAVRDWVDVEMPVYRSEDDRDTYLISLVRNRAQEAGVEIVSGPNSRDPELDTFFEQTLVNVAVQGEIGPIVRWLHGLQAPGEFRAVTSLLMKPAKKESSELRCEITLEQWWSLDSRGLAMADGGGTIDPTAGGSVPGVMARPEAGSTPEPSPGITGPGSEFGVPGPGEDPDGSEDADSAVAVPAEDGAAAAEQGNENEVQEGNEPEDS